MWLAQLMSYDFDIIYKNWSENRATDALSRVFCQEIMSLALSLVSTSLDQQIRDSYAQDAGIQKIIMDLQ